MIPEGVVLEPIKFDMHVHLFLNITKIWFLGPTFSHILLTSAFFRPADTLKKCYGHNL